MRGNSLPPSAPARSKLGLRWTYFPPPFSPVCIVLYLLHYVLFSEKPCYPILAWFLAMMTALAADRSTRTGMYPDDAGSVPRCRTSDTTFAKGPWRDRWGRWWQPLQMMKGGGQRLFFFESIRVHRGTCPIYLGPLASIARHTWRWGEGFCVTFAWSSILTRTWPP